MTSALPLIDAASARRVLLRSQELADPPRRSGPAAVAAMVDRLGYLQIDSINVVDRAHHLTLATRLEGFRPAHIAHAIEKSRRLFEHWTHDACAVPARWLPHWMHRFERQRTKKNHHAWWRERFAGDPEPVLRRVLARVEREGPLRARDFERPSGSSSGWWSWHPEKAALEHLWRCGRLAIARRERFEKVYDLFERVHPEAKNVQPSSDDEHLAWACGDALDRLGIATPREIAAFFNAVPLAAATAWCRNAVRTGRAIDVRVERVDGRPPIAAIALRTWSERAEPIDDEAMRVLCPFDPVIRDRARVERLFGFTYRFEAFTPEAKRIHGYYVLPLLVGDALVGRIDPKFDRDAGVLRVRGPWWEPKRGGRGDRTKLEAALERCASILGAERVLLEGVRTSGPRS
jgi:uncharacterized protein YcaQ